MQAGSVDLHARRVGYEQRRKESQHGCSSATCGEWEPLRVWVDSWVVGLVAQTERSGEQRLFGFYSAEQRLPTERNESVTK